MSDKSALAGRIKEDFITIEKVVARAISLQGRALATGDDGFWDGVALNLHSFYTGIERIFEDIARTIDENIPSGPDWHRSLLLQMSAEIERRRPAVIRRDTRDCLEEYRGFRHVVRNVYAFNFKSARLEELVSALPGCLSQVKRDLLEFTDFLEQI